MRSGCFGEFKAGTVPDFIKGFHQGQCPKRPSRIVDLLLSLCLAPEVFLKESYEAYGGGGKWELLD